jgi:hypothetical protein
MRGLGSGCNALALAAPRKSRVCVLNETLNSVLFISEYLCLNIIFLDYIDIITHENLAVYIEKLLYIVINYET